MASILVREEHKANFFDRYITLYMPIFYVRGYYEQQLRQYNEQICSIVVRIIMCLKNSTEECSIFHFECLTRMLHSREKYSRHTVFLIAAQNAFIFCDLQMSSVIIFM